jgi:probable rRNA maturation factor
MIFIQFSESLASANGPGLVEGAILEHAAQQVLQYAHTDKDTDVSIVLADDDKLRELNQQFLGMDIPTDVLAFPGGETDPDTRAYYLGDVILSYPRALAQAVAGGHPVEAELQLLVVHGMLHLLGHDHTGPDEKAAMWAAQAEILSLLGCPISGPNEGGGAA